MSPRDLRVVYNMGMDLSSLGKPLVLFGILLVLVGILLMLGAKVPYLGKLPGDIRIERENFSLYFPLMTCLLLSALLSFIFWVVSKLK